MSYFRNDLVRGGPSRADYTLFLDMFFWARKGLKNDPEPLGDVLTKLGPKRGHVDPVRAKWLASKLTI